jgi:hypothetical protein
MPDMEKLKSLCLNDAGQPKTKNECRSAIINHLILEEMIDVMEAEDITEQTLRELNLWPDEPAVDVKELLKDDNDPLV